MTQNAARRPEHFQKMLKGLDVGPADEPIFALMTLHLISPFRKPGILEADPI